MSLTADLISVPHSVRVVDAVTDWRANLAWPLHQSRRSQLAETAIDVLSRWRAGLPEGPIADAADLSSLHLASIGGRMLLHSNEISEGLKRGIDLVGADQEFAFLRGREDRPARLRVPFEPVVRPTDRIFAPLRAVRHASGWTSRNKLAKAIFRPDAHVISTSGMLLDAARNEDVALSYCEPGALLARARQAGKTSAIDTQELVENFADFFLANADIPEPLRRRAHELLVYQGSEMLRRADAVMAGLRQIRNFPRNVWGGSAGGYAARAIGLEVLRRGGQVRRFAHGGAIGLDDYAAVHAVIEMAATSEYVATTAATHRLLQHAHIAQRFIRHTPTFSAGWGDPKFRRIPYRCQQRNGARPKVLYTGTTFPGPLVHVPPVPPEAVYLDWQIRLVNSLQASGADVLCKPHPENVDALGYQPLTKFFPAIDTPFEQAIEQADVLIHDYCLSTTFFEAMCSDRPIVLLDLGLTRWRPEIESAIRSRCRVLTVSYDERNRPQFDVEELKDAVLSAPRSVDPWQFRNLLAGDEQPRVAANG